MTIFTAAEAAEQEARATYDNEQETRAADLIQGLVVPAIKEACEKGKNNASLIFDYMDELLVRRISRVLSENGYKVATSIKKYDLTLSINW